MKGPVIAAAMALAAGPPAPPPPPKPEPSADRRLPQPDKPSAAQRHIPGLF